MSIPRIALLAVAAALASSCVETATSAVGAASSIRVINASGVPLDVRIDGTVAIFALGIANVSLKMGIPAGSHVVGLRTTSCTVTNISLQAIANQTMTTAVVPGTSSNLR